MAEEKTTTNWKKKWWKGGRPMGSSGSGAVYGLGFIGAAVYFVQHATTFSGVVIGILKAIVWPALLVFKALELLKM